MQQNNYITDDFLFGHDLPVDINQYNKLLRKSKIKPPNKKEFSELLSCSRSFRFFPFSAEPSGDLRPRTVGQPATFEMAKHTTQSKPVSSQQARMAPMQKTMEKKSNSTVNQKRQGGDFQKRKDEISVQQTHGYQSRDLHLDERKIMHDQKSTIDKLTQQEHKKLKEMRDLQLEKFHRMAQERFDSKKNWSIMIDQRDNEIRNQVMRNTKFQQLKKRCLHDFMRKAKEDLIREKMGQTGHFKSEDEEEMEAEMRLTQQMTQGHMREQFLKQKQDRMIEKRKKVIDEYKNDFLKYFEMKLTKQEMILDSANVNNANKIPKRKQLTDKDSVEAIAANIQTLINFGKDQRNKMGDMKKLPNNNTSSSFNLGKPSK